MSLKISRKIGRTTISVDGSEADLIKVLRGASWLIDAPPECSNCQSADIKPVGKAVVAKQGENVGEKFEYLEMRCNNCQATAQAGTFKDKSGFFWKNNGEMVKWAGGGVSTPQIAKNDGFEPDTDEDEDNVPF